MTGKVEIISHTYRKIKGKYYARIRYKIDDGKPLDILRQLRTSLRSNRSRQRSKLNYCSMDQHNPCR